MALPPAYNSIKELGVYDKLPENIKTQLPLLTKLSGTAKAKAEEAVNKELAKDDTKTKLMKEVEGLADSALKVDEAFERVRVGLGNVDKNNYKDKDGKPIDKFQPRWVGYQKRWTKLLWDSRDTATATEAYIKDFVNVIVPDVQDIKNDDDLADARKDLKAFVNRVDPFGKKLNSKETTNAAQKFSQDFTDLRRELEEFKNTFDSFAKDHEVKLGIEITSRENKITELNLEIKKCETVVMAMGIALGVTIFVAAAGAVASLAAFGPLGPAIAIGVLIVGAIAAISELGVLIAYIVKTNDFKSERDRVQRELDDLKKQLAELKRIKAILDSQKADITDICGRLDRFASVWGIVRHDAQLISEDLNAAVGDEGSKKAFKRRVDLIRISYTQLGEALSLYATKVNNSGAKK